MSSAPRLTPSNRNWTPTTLMLSEAVAVTVIVPVTCAPLVGAVIVTDGGVVSLFTVTVILFVARLPAASRATADKVCDPLLDPVVTHETE